MAGGAEVIALNLIPPTHYYYFFFFFFFFFFISHTLSLVIHYTLVFSHTQFLVSLHLVTLINEVGGRNSENEGKGVDVGVRLCIMRCCVGPTGSRRVKASIDDK